MIGMNELALILACGVGALNFGLLIVMGVHFMRVWQDYKHPR